MSDGRLELKLDKDYQKEVTSTKVMVVIIRQRV